MKRLFLSSIALLALAGAAQASTVTLGGQVWDTTNSGNVTLNAVVPGGNQPQNAPCLICGANQPQQPTGFGYNDFSNGGNITDITAFSDQGNGGRNTLLDNTIGALNPGYDIGPGSLFLAFLLANNSGNGFSIGVDVNDTNQPQTLNSFYLLDLTTHTVLSSYTGGTVGNVGSANNGTGFPDYTLDGFTLNGANVGDQIMFVARMSGLNDGPDSFFLEPGPAVPEPSTWAMLLLGFAGIGLMGLRRRNGSFRMA